MRILPRGASLRTVSVPPSVRCTRYLPRVGAAPRWGLPARWGERLANGTPCRPSLACCGRPGVLGGRCLCLHWPIELLHHCGRSHAWPGDARLLASSGAPRLPLRAPGISAHAHRSALPAEGGRARRLAVGVGRGIFSPFLPLLGYLHGLSYASPSFFSILSLALGQRGARPHSWHCGARALQM